MNAMSRFGLVALYKHQILIPNYWGIEVETERRGLAETSGRTWFKNFKCVPYTHVLCFRLRIGNSGG